MSHDSTANEFYQSQILQADYKIQDFKNINPKKDPYIANWTGKVNDYNTNSDTEDIVSGFFKVSNKGKKLKIYLDDGDGVFSSKSDTLLSKLSLDNYESRAMASYRKGKFDIKYFRDNYIDNRGEFVQNTYFEPNIYANNYDFYVYGSISTDAGIDEFSKYVRPCML